MAIWVHLVVDVVVVVVVVVVVAEGDVEGFGRAHSPKIAPLLVCLGTYIGRGDVVRIPE